MNASLELNFKIRIWDLIIKLYERLNILLITHDIDSPTVNNYDNNNDVYIRVIAPVANTNKLELGVCAVICMLEKLLVSEELLGVAVAAALYEYHVEPWVVRCLLMKGEVPWETLFPPVAATANYPISLSRPRNSISGSAVSEQSTSSDKVNFIVVG